MAAATMCGSALRAARGSPAAARSPNARAAVLFDPMTPARIERLPSVALRKAATSFTTTPAQTTSTATVVVVMMMRIILRWIDRSRNFMSAPGFGPDDLREPKHLRADFELGAPRRVHVDLETNHALLQIESDDAAARREVLGLADGEHRGLPQAGEHLLERAGLRPGREQDVAGPELPEVLQPPDANRPALDLLAADHVVDVRPERILAEDAEDEGGVAVGERLAGPGDEPSEVDQEGGLHLVLGRRLGP